MVSTQKVLLLMGAKSRQGLEGFKESTEFLQKRGFIILNTEEELKDAGENLGEVIDRYAEEKPYVIIAGGDGTVNSCLPQLLQHQLTLAVLAQGTANNLARTLGLPTEREEALSKVGGFTQKIDVGFVNGIPFLNVVGLGLSTEINRTTPSQLKKWFGPVAFVLNALRIAFLFKPFRCEIKSNGSIQQGKSWQITVCNGRHYGNGLTIAHDAKIDDHRLDCLSAEVPSLWKGFALIPSLLSGKYKADQEVLLLQGTDFEITTRKVRNVDIDGDIKTKTPLKFSIKPLALEVFV